MSASYSVAVPNKEKTVAKICCFAQRQDGHVIGLVKMAGKEMDLSTCRLIMGEALEGEDPAKASERLLREQTRLEVNYTIAFYQYRNEQNGECVEVYDMDVRRNSVPKSSDGSAEIAVWCHPWHLANGVDGDLARQVFQFNETRVVEPVIYGHARNKEIVMPDEPDEEDEKTLV